MKLVETTLLVHTKEIILLSDTILLHLSSIGHRYSKFTNLAELYSQHIRLKEIVMVYTGIIEPCIKHACDVGLFSTVYFSMPHKQRLRIVSAIEYTVHM